MREIFELQCGRIYKDAEISPLARGFIIAGLVLQCGRIYKDAEITYRSGGGGPDARKLQCGRIYKDAEISGLLRAAFSG